MRNLRQEDNLSVLWYCLKILGINIGIQSSKSKAISKIVSINILIGSIWSIWIQLRALKIMPVKYILYSSMISTVTNVFMYFTLLKSKSKLKVLRKMLLLINAGSKTDKLYIFIYGIIFIAFAIPLIMSIAHSTMGIGIAKDIYSVYEFENRHIRKGFSIIGVIVTYFVQVTIPAVLNCFFCAVCYQWKEVIASVILEVRRSGRDIFCNPSKMVLANSLLEKCRFLWHGTKQIKQAFSSFLLYQVSTQVVAIFLVLCFVKFRSNFDFENTHFFLAMVVFSFSSTVYLASKIPEKLEEIVAILKEMDEDMKFKNDDGKLGPLKKRMKTILKKKPIALSVGGWADMNRNFIAATFGGIVTYGLIITQN